MTHQITQIIQTTGPNWSGWLIKPATIDPCCRPPTTPEFDNLPELVTHEPEGTVYICRHATVWKAETEAGVPFRHWEQQHGRQAKRERQRLETETDRKRMRSLGMSTQ